MYEILKEFMKCILKYLQTKFNNVLRISFFMTKLASFQRYKDG